MASTVTTTTVENIDGDGDFISCWDSGMTRHFGRRRPKKWRGGSGEDSKERKSHQPPPTLSDEGRSVNQIKSNCPKIRGRAGERERKKDKRQRTKTDSPAEGAYSAVVS